MESFDSTQPCFLIFYHNPFQRGNEGVEDGTILEQLIYKYPETIPDTAIEVLLGVIVSLYTFTTLALNGRNLDCLSWTKSKLAIRSTKNPTDGSLLYFVLCVPDICSNAATISTIDYLKSGIFFALGDKMYSIQELRNYLELHGNSICSILPSNLDPIQFSFYNMPNAEWHRSSVTTILTQVHLMQTYSQLWGIACYVGNLLLVSHSPISLFRYVNFVEDNPRTEIFLTKDDRAKLIDYPNSIAQIPDEDIIKALLLKFQHESIVFYLIADPNIENDLYEKVHETLAKIIPELATVSPDDQKLNFPNNTLVYNNILCLLRNGQTTEEFQRSCIHAHDLFSQDHELRDLITYNAREFTIGMNIVNFEHYASINGGRKLSLPEMYDEALRANPELIPFLQSFDQ